MSIVTAVTVITIPLITNIKIAIILIGITKSDYHNSNSSDNSDNNNSTNNHNNNNNNNNTDNNKSLFEFNWKEI